MSQFLSRILGKSSEPAWIEPADLAVRVATAGAPLVVDVRRPDEFAGPLGHIEGAMNLPLDQVPNGLHALRQQQRPIVLVCHTDRRSAAAAAMLQQAGFTDVAVLRGGMVAWQAMARG